MTTEFKFGASEHDDQMSNEQSRTVSASAEDHEEPGDVSHDVVAMIGVEQQDLDEIQEYFDNANDVSDL